MPQAAGWIVYVPGDDHVIWGADPDFDVAWEKARAEMWKGYTMIERLKAIPATQALLDADASDWDDFGWDMVDGVAVLSGEM